MFEKYLNVCDDGLILIGHSLGGITIAKYLSENVINRKIKATFLVAAPYNTPKLHPLVDFNITQGLDRLQNQGGKIFLYHSQDDLVVPVSNLADYQKALPGAAARIFKNQGHFHQASFPKLVEDIKSLD